ncbi:MAG: hypothetical protein KDD35_06845, partial [Bdellovibrionales bacterium]|nr:hypothetical protein [Bdellovibrionales bacterium]
MFLAFSIFSCQGTFHSQSNFGQGKGFAQETSVVEVEIEIEEQKIDKNLDCLNLTISDEACAFNGENIAEVAIQLPQKIEALIQVMWKLVNFASDYLPISNRLDLAEKIRALQMKLEKFIASVEALLAERIADQQKLIDQ